MHMIAPTTSFYAALLGLLILYLAYRVVRQRRAQKVGLGDGGDASVEHAMRVMANFVEYVPLALLLIVLLELNSTPAWMIHIFGASLVFARVYHLRGFGRHTGVSRGRVVGTLVTWLVIALAALANLVHYVVYLL